MKRQVMVNRQMNSMLLCPEMKPVTPLGPFEQYWPVKNLNVNNKRPQRNGP